MRLPPGLRALLAPALFALAAAPASGQAADSTARPATPLLRLHGAVSADRVVHRAAPRVHVRFSGTAPDTLSAATRTNLPRPVTPGETYRNVRVTFEVVSGVPEIEAWLRDVLPAPVPPPDDR